MAFLLAVKILVMAAGFYVFARAIYRRIGRRAERGALDPAVTRGVWVEVVALAGFLLGMTLLLLPFRLPVRWPPWVGKLAAALAIASLVVAFPLAAWLGWRLFDEEWSVASREDAADTDHDRVT